MGAARAALANNSCFSYWNFRVVGYGKVWESHLLCCSGASWGFSMRRLLIEEVNDNGGRRYEENAECPDL